MGAHRYCPSAQIHAIGSEGRYQAFPLALRLQAQSKTWVILTWPQSPYSIVRLDDGRCSDTDAQALISRSVLSSGIYELWGVGSDYLSLHRDVRRRTEPFWTQYKQASFRFTLDSFQGSKSLSEQRKVIEGFSYMGFEGRIVMSNPKLKFVVFEDYGPLKADGHGDDRTPKQLYLGRFVAESGRKTIGKYNLKKREYIATTSMDAELSLVTANLGLARPGSLAYDPFMGTGSFPLACAHSGATVLGSDLDGRSIRGRKGKNVKGNFKQYDTQDRYLGGFISDLTHTPLRVEPGKGWLDLVICDPPYGVREGLKVLGSEKEKLQQEVVLQDGTLAHLKEGYIPPKRPYSFTRMLEDILDFSSSVLVDEGRLCMWMPVAGSTRKGGIGDHDPEAAVEYAVPMHPALRLVSLCTQDFNKWSRRLLTYRRLADADVDADNLAAYRLRRVELQGGASDGGKRSADDLNNFRKKYFQGFRSQREGTFDAE